MKHFVFRIIQKTKDQLVRFKVSVSEKPASMHGNKVLFEM